MTKKNSFLSPKDAIEMATQFILTAKRQNPSISDADAVASATNSIYQILVVQFPAGSFPENAIRAMADEIGRQAQRNIELDSSKEAFIKSISPEELDNIQKLIDENAKAIKNTLRSEPNGEVFVPGVDEVANLLIALTAHALSMYHASGWIKYDKKEIVALAGLNKLPVARQEAITKQVHDSFGFEMRVIGSNQPIPCYSLPWLVPPQSESTAIRRFDPVKIQSSILAALKLL